jgi:glycosyltransferase involved in cell wall biosynthesis
MSATRARRRLRPRAAGPSTARSRSNEEAAVLDVLLVGPYPPPFGGISVHIKRLVDVLHGAGLRVGVLNHYSSRDSEFVLGALRKNPFNYAVSIRRTPARVVHYHHSRWIHFFVVALFRTKQSRYVVTLHAGDVDQHFPQIASRGAVMRGLTTWALRRYDTVVVVNPAVASFLQERRLHPHVELIPAYIPSEGGEGALPYEPDDVAFLESGTLISATAFSVQFLPDGRELYGLDTLVSAFLSVSAASPELRLAIFMARPPSGARPERHLAALEARLAEHGLERRVRIFYGMEFAPSLARSALFVRPTRADGDAVSIREALGAGVPVVASDVVHRPAGVVTFATDDAEVLADAMTRLLGAGSRTPATEPDDDRPWSFSGDLLQLYRSYLGLSGERLPGSA